MTRRVLYRLFWIPFAIVLCGLTFVYASEPYVLQAPGKLVPFATDDHSFGLLHPENWKAHQATMSAVMTSVAFEPSLSVQFTVKSDLAGSLIADAGRSADITAQLQGLAQQAPGLAGQLQATTKSPLEAAHDAEGAALAKDDSYPDFHDGAVEKDRVAGLDALTSDFTFDKRELFAKSNMAGRRYTLLATDRRISIIYSYPAALKATYEPVFQQMVASITAGQGG